MKILVIGLSGIGDLIMGTPMILALKKEYPGADISLLVFPGGHKEVLSKSEYIKEIYEYIDRKHAPTKKLPNILKSAINQILLILKLRKQRFDLSLSLINATSIKQAALARIIGAKRRIGFEQNLFTDPVKIDRSGIHDVEQNLRLLKPLGIKVKIRKPYFHLLDANRKNAKRFLNENKIKNEILIAIHPGGYWRCATRRWPLKNFAELGDKLIEKYKSKILVICGPGEEKGAEQMKEIMKNKEDLVIVKDKNLKDIAALIERCKIFVGNDSGVMHIASCFVPTIGIFGYTDYIAHAPYRNLVIRKDLECFKECPVNKGDFAYGEKCGLKCFSSIEVGEVIKGVDKLLKK